jgi:hypothetical protein
MHDNRAGTSYSPMSTPMSLSSNAMRLALIPFLWLLMCTEPLSAATSDTESPTIDSVFLQYENLKPKVTALASDIRDARKEGRSIESGRILLVRKEVGDFVKALRRYDKDHLRAAKGAKTYPDREKLLRLFHISDAVHRWIEAETKATDFQILGLKYEDMWKQADAALTDKQTTDR